MTNKNTPEGVPLYKIVHTRDALVSGLTAFPATREHQDAVSKRKAGCVYWLYPMRNGQSPSILQEYYITDCQA